MFYTNTKKRKCKREKKIVYVNTSEMCNDYPKTYFNQSMALSDNRKSKLGNKYDPVNIFLVYLYNYDGWFKNEKSPDATTKS